MDPEVAAYAPADLSEQTTKRPDEPYMSPNPRLLLTPLRHTKVRKEALLFPEL